MYIRNMPCPDKVGFFVESEKTHIGGDLEISFVPTFLETKVTVIISEVIQKFKEISLCILIHQ